jgi:serine/threonine protein kinase
VLADGQAHGLGAQSGAPPPVHTICAAGRFESPPLPLTTPAALAHTQVVHRDIKLENVTLTSKKPSEADCKLADFGLARRLRSETAVDPPSP